MTYKTKVKNSDTNRHLILMVIAGLIGVVAIAAIVISATGTSLNATSIDYASIPQSRTADGAFILGDPEAPVTIVAFEDFLCPACQGYQGVIKQFIQDYVVTGQARFEYRMLPAVDPTYSTVAASLAECSDELRPGSFWDAHDTLFTLASSQRFNPNTARQFSERMGLSYSQILDCTKDARQWQVDQALATQNNVSGTPTILIRYGNGPLQPSPVGPRPAIDGFGILVNSAR